MSFPSEWKAVKFGEIAEQIISRIDNPEKSTLVDYIGLGHIESNNLKISNYGNKDDVVSSKFICRKGDIIFSRRRAYLRKLAISDRDALVSTDAMVIRPKADFSREFLVLSMQTDRFWNEVIARSAGSLSPRIKWRDLSRINVLLPPAKMREKITRLIFSVQDNLEKTEEFIQVAEKLNKGLLEELLTKGIGHKKVKKTELGEISEDWNIVEIMNIASVKSGGSAPQGTELFGGENKFIRVQHLDCDRNIVNGFDRITDDAVKKGHLRLFKKGTILFPKSGATVYLEKRVTLPFDSYVVSHICCVNSLDEKTILNEYLFYLFKNMKLAPNKDLIQYPTIKLSEIRKIKIPLPTLEEQNRIVAILNSISSLLDKQTSIFISLTALKRKLTNSFLLGELLIPKENGN